MYQIDTSSAALVEPVPAAPGTAGFFTDGDPVLGVPATQVSADWLNDVQDELINVILAGGLTPSKTVHTQLRDAVKKIVEIVAGGSALDTGTANTYTVALNPAISAYTDGLNIRVRFMHACTGASTIDAGAGRIPLVRDDGTPLQANDIVTDDTGWVGYVAATNNFRMLATVPSQLGAAAGLNVGPGLRNDGAGNLETVEVVVTKGANYAQLAADHAKRFQWTAAANYTLLRTNTLFNGFYTDVDARGGDVTLVPDAADSFEGGTAGASITIPKGCTGHLVIDDSAANWQLTVAPIAGAGQPVRWYAVADNNAVLLPYRGAMTDASGGAFTLKLPPNPIDGMWVPVGEGAGAAAQGGGTNVTIDGNGKNIVADTTTATFTFDMSNLRFIFAFRASANNWRLILG